MIRGMIRVRHVLTHPMTLIGAFGIAGYLRLIARCIARHDCFADVLFH